MSRKKYGPRARGTGTVRRRGDGFDARWRGDDGKEQSRRFPTEGAAHEFLDEQMVAKRKAAKAGAKYKSPNDRGPKFATLAEEFIRDRAAKDRAPKTLIGYRSVLDNYLLPRFGTMHVSAITVAHVETMLSDLVGRGLAPATVTKAVRTLSPILKRAQRHGYITTNPCDLLETRRAGGKPKHTMIDSAQVELLASQIDPHYRPLVMLLAFGGLRWSEATGLRWGDIDFDRGVIHVRRTVAEISVAAAKRAALPGVTPGFVEGPTKNKHERTTVLLPRVAALLSPGAPDEPVFRMESGAALRGDNFRKRNWAPAVKAAVAKSAEGGLTPFPANLRIHDLRHAFVSIAYNEVGLSPLAISKMSGHLNLSTMLDIYTHLFDGWDTDLAGRFESALTAPTLTVIEGGRSEPTRRAS